MVSHHITHKVASCYLTMIYLGNTEEKLCVQGPGLSRIKSVSLG
jgi:hypothetical protein